MQQTNECGCVVDPETGQWWHVCLGHAGLRDDPAWAPLMSGATVEEDHG
jgi:hypothetical protein